MRRGMKVKCYDIYILVNHRKRRGGEVR